MPPKQYSLILYANNEKEAVETAKSWSWGCETRLYRFTCTAAQLSSSSFCYRSHLGLLLLFSPLRHVIHPREDSSDRHDVALPLYLSIRDRCQFSWHLRPPDGCPPPVSARSARQAFSEPWDTMLCRIASFSHKNIPISSPCCHNWKLEGGPQYTETPFIRVVWTFWHTQQPAHGAPWGN